MPDAVAHVNLGCCCRYPFYKNMGAPQWKSCIRHNLSTKKKFFAHHLAGPGRTTWSVCAGANPYKLAKHRKLHGPAGVSERAPFPAARAPPVPSAAPPACPPADRPVCCSARLHACCSTRLDPDRCVARSSRGSQLHGKRRSGRRGCRRPAVPWGRKQPPLPPSSAPVRP